MSAAVGGAMAASMTSSRGGGGDSLALIERLEAANEKTAAGIDEFSRLFGQDDIRLLVDLLKLSVSGRCSGGGGGAGRIVVQTVLPGPDKHSRPHPAKITAIFLELSRSPIKKICRCMIFQSTTTIKNKKTSCLGRDFVSFYFCSPFLD